MKKANLFLSALLGLGLTSTIAQELSVDALIRPRFEYRHGFQDVAPEDIDGSAFVSQRSSLLLKYSDEKITTFLDLQGTSIWGDRPQLSTDDGSSAGQGFRVNQGWAQIKLGNNGWSTKVGRMVLSYDDQRILGGLGWADQQRTHDAALIKYAKEGFKMDIGFSFNQNGITNFNTVFTAGTTGQTLFQYKAMQYAHLNNKFSDAFSASFLFINNQFQDVVDGVGVDGTSSRQTTGIYGKYKKDAFGFDFSGYYQFGEIVSGTDISAYDVAANFTYKPGSTLFGAGIEILSGNDTDSGEQEAFFPLYGTNHKFNGFQDLFYVGRHANDGGLMDINAKAVFKLCDKSSLLTKFHYFSGMEDQAAYDSGYYGTSIDLVFTQKITPYAKLNVGYSQSFLDDDFANARASRGSDVPLEADSNQNWMWVMLTIKPNIFKWKKEPENK